MSNEEVLNNPSVKPPPAKPARRSKKDERIENLEASLERLINLVSKKYSDDVNKSDIVESTTSNVGSSVESARKRKQQDTLDTTDNATLDSPKKTNTDADQKHQQSKSEMIYASSPDRKRNHVDSIRIPIVPKFDGKSKNMKELQEWLMYLESVAKKYSLEEATLIDMMKKNLEGDLLQWFNQEKNLDISWKKWKKLLSYKLQSSFAQDQVDKLQEFVCTYRRQGEKTIDFCYYKKKQGDSLGLDDSLICNVIINRLRHPFLEEEVQRAGCTDTKSLLKFLSDHFAVEQTRTCGLCGRRGHTSSQCYGPCKHCNKTGHRPEFCVYRL